MNVFISWSGDRSKAVAEILQEWMKCVLQATRPWISTRDIDRGAIWFTEINDQIKDTTIGIICLTPENKNNPWILFEAGALAKGLPSNRVCTLLIDLKSTDLEPPLSQFNHTFPDKNSMLDLVRTLNKGLGQNGLDGRILDQVFSTYWSHFERKYNEIKGKFGSMDKPEPRSEPNILAEILENTRFLSQRVRSLEKRFERINDSIGCIDDIYPGLDETSQQNERLRLLQRDLMNLRHQSVINVTPGTNLAGIRKGVDKIV